MKRKMDMYFLIFAIILLVLSFIFIDILPYTISLCIGVLCGSVINEKDIRKAQKDNLKAMGINLTLNLVVYGIVFIGCGFLFGPYGVIYSGLGLVAYRTFLFRKLAKIS